MMHLGWPQIIFCTWLVIGAYDCAAKDGQPKTGQVSFGGFLLGAYMLCALLYWGGFFGR